MKIIMMPAAYYPALGGTELTTKMIAESLAKRGHQVSIAVADISSFSGYYDLRSPPTGRPQFELVNGVEIHRFSLYNRFDSSTAQLLTRSRLSSTVNWLGIKALRLKTRYMISLKIDRLIKKISPDVIIALPHLQPNVIIASRLAAKNKVWFGFFPFVHVKDPHYPIKSVINMASKSNAVFCVTKNEKDLLIQKLGILNEKVVYSGLGTTIPNPVYNNHKEGVNNTPNEILVLFVGRKTKSKGLELLSQAMDLLNVDGYSIKLVLVGARAEDTGHIESLFERRSNSYMFESHDNVSEEELGYWFNRCNFVVLPSKEESFGLVILEAWAHKKPVITLDLPVFREIVEDRVDGLLVRSDDAVNLSSSIRELSSNIDLAKDLGNAGFNKVKSIYTWSSVVERMISCFPNV